MIYEIFPEALQDLNREVSWHPELQKRLLEQREKDIYIKILEIATYCDLAVAGDFTRDDILALCSLCTKMLYQKRTAIIIPSLPH